MNQKFYILLDRMEIQAANAVSSPITYGFPAVSGFVGAVHALSRRLPEDFPLKLQGVVIASHRCTPYIFRSDDFSDAVFVQTRNPILKTGETRPIVEEGKVNLTVSLIIEATAQEMGIIDHADEWCQQLRELAYTQRFAGGSVHHIQDVRLFAEYECREMILRICPSYILQEASAELEAVTAELRTGDKHYLAGCAAVRTNPPMATGIAPQPQASTLDALLATASLYHVPTEPDAKDKKWSTYSVKTGRGWIVPIPVGYQAISELYAAGEMENCRHNGYPAQYVENIYSLGKWVFSVRLLRGESAAEMLADSVWRYQPPRDGIYRISTAHLQLSEI